LTSVETDAQPAAGREPARQELKVLYVVGYGRSGSTILGNILGELDGVVHVGELRSFWGLGLLGRRVCGCGLPIRECELWARVVKAGFGSDGDRADPRTVLDWQRDAVRLRNTRRLLRSSSGGSGGWASLDAYVPVATRLYGAISEATGARVIVDTSKHVADGALLPLLPGIDASFVHLVRDPRAVAYSWQRVVASPGEGRRQQMPRHGPFTTARAWTATNLGAEAILRRVGRRRGFTMRYEDFVAEPRPWSARAAELLGEDPGELPFVDDHTVRLGPNHTAGGNPSRLAGGAVRIRPDDEWRSRQPVVQRVIATAGTFPLLRRYGYPVWPGGRRR
jgi:hypothetical protein